MVRRLVVIFTSVVLFAAAHAKALGLGDIVLESALNQPLNAQIALLELGDVRPEQVQVQIADERDFARFSIERKAFLNVIELAVQTQGGDAFVSLSTAEQVSEPYLSFVLETRWPSGRLLSEYTVLLDPPAFAAGAQTSQTQSPMPAYPSAGAVSPARLAAPAEPESVASQEAAPSSPARNANPNDTVTIGSADTLWDVALQVRPDSSVSVQQTMLALQSLNREAFIGDNINMVRRGQVLRVPTLEQIRSLSAREAISEVARQNQLFENRRNVPLASQPLTAQPQRSPATAPANNGELSVVSVDNTEPAAQPSGSGRSAELDARIVALEDALAVQREEADRATLRNAELVERLGMLEEQIVSAQEIIRLRDLELAQLQQALAEAAAAEASVEPVEAEIDTEAVQAPTVITRAPEKGVFEKALDTFTDNTYALLTLLALIIVLLVFALLRRNRLAEQAALAEMDALPTQQGGDEAMSAYADEAGSTLNPQGSANNNAIDADELVAFRASQTPGSLFAADSAVHVEPETVQQESLETLEEPVEEVQQEQNDDTLRQDIHSAEPEDIIEDADELIAFERTDAAEALLRDAIVAHPERVDLRMKMLEVFVAKQDAINFKLQETEIRDMGVKGLEPHIATLREQLDNEEDSEILEEGEEAFFNELRELDDLEAALDLEATAEVDDEKVRSGAFVDEPSSEEHIDLEAGNSIDFEFANDDESVAAAVQDAALTPAVASDTEPEPEQVSDFDFATVHEDDGQPESGVPHIYEESLADEDEENGSEINVELRDEEEGDENLAFNESIFDVAPEDKASSKAETNNEDFQFAEDSASPAAHDDVLDFVSGADEAATKLDLARAYFEMGDIEGARQTLEEVLKQGSDEQVNDATELLAKL